MDARRRWRRGLGQTTVGNWKSVHVEEHGEDRPTLLHRTSVYLYLLCHGQACTGGAAAVSSVTGRPMSAAWPGSRKRRPVSRNRAMRPSPSPSPSHPDCARLMGEDGRKRPGGGWRRRDEQRVPSHRPGGRGAQRSSGQPLLPLSVAPPAPPVVARFHHRNPLCISARMRRRKMRRKRGEREQPPTATNCDVLAAASADSRDAFAFACPSSWLVRACAVGCTISPPAAPRPLSPLSPCSRSSRPW